MWVLGPRLGPLRSSGTQLIPELRLWLDSNPIINRLSEPLLASQIFLGRLYRYMTKQELDLLQFTSRIMTEPGTRSSKIMWCELRDSKSFRIFLHNVPDHFLCHFRSPNRTIPTDTP